MWGLATGIQAEGPRWWSGPAGSPLPFSRQKGRKTEANGGKRSARAELTRRACSRASRRAARKISWSPKPWA